MRFAAKVLMCVLLSGCATTKPIVLPPEIVKIPERAPLPPECGTAERVALPPGSSAAQVMAEQSKAIDLANAKLKRCYVR